MKTKIRLAGGSFDEDGKVIWQGEMPLVQGNGMRIVDDSDEDSPAKVYYVSQVAFHFNPSESWQTVFVIPTPGTSG